MPRSTASAVLLAAAALLAGCAADSADRVLSIDATGEVVGVAFIDRDGDLQNNVGADGLAPGVRLTLVVRGTRDTAATTTTDVAGAFTFRAVPVGNYRVVVDTLSFGDSLRVARIDTADITVAAGDTLRVDVAIGYRPLGIADARQLPVGQRVFVEGVALNTWSTFGDSTVHVADATGAIRLARLPALNFAVADSVGVLGTLELLSGRPVLTDVTAFRIGQAAVPEPHAVSTATAATADGGALDAALGRITGEILTTQTTATNDVDLTVDDGSGPAVVRIDRDLGIPTGTYVPGALLDATGLLVSDGAGPWRLKPRGEADLVLDYRDVTVAQARNEPVGQLVRVRGVALNAWDTFGDSTVHVADATGAIRGIRVQQSGVQAGDSIRLVGRVARHNGEPVLSEAAAFPVTTATQPPQPVPLSTGLAATAGAPPGEHDAALVAIADATILSAGDEGRDRRLVVTDGSGALEVLIDGDTGIPTALLVPGAVLDLARGVLVPLGNSKWELKPRSADDVTAHIDTVTIAEARQLQAGQTVYIEGVALTGPVTFGPNDRTMHIRDATGALRSINVSTSVTGINAGQLVRLLGTIAFNNGQTVLNPVAEVLVIGTGTATPVTVTVADAANARNGELDAELVHVQNATITSVGSAGGDFLVTVGGGTTDLQIRIDPDTPIQTGGLTVGAQIDATGVLIPVSAAGVWYLKPRFTGDIVVH